MKKIGLYLLATVLVTLAYSVQGFAQFNQASADVDVSIELLDRLQLATEGVNFGIVEANTAGTYTFDDPNTVSGGDVIGTPSAGSVSITGSAGYEVLVEFANGGPIALGSTDVQYTPAFLNSFTSGSSVTLDANGEATLDIGGSVDVSSGASDDTYSGVVTVDVSYTNL